MKNRATISSRKASGIDALVPDIEPAAPAPAQPVRKEAKPRKINKTFPFVVSTAEKLDVLAWLGRKEKSQLLMEILEEYFTSWEQRRKLKIEEVMQDVDYLEYLEHQKNKRQK